MFDNCKTDDSILNENDELLLGNILTDWAVILDLLIWSFEASIYVINVIGYN